MLCNFFFSKSWENYLFIYWLYVTFLAFPLFFPLQRDKTHFAFTQAIKTERHRNWHLNNYIFSWIHKLSNHISLYTRDICVCVNPCSKSQPCLTMFFYPFVLLTFKIASNERRISTNRIICVYVRGDVLSESMSITLQYEQLLQWSPVWLII